MGRLRVVILGYLLLVPASLAASQQPPHSPPVVRPHKIETPPQVDGRLNDPAWSEVDPITDFFQTEPRDHAPASERTEVRICYDSRNLYFGIRAWESEPDRLVRSLYERDGFMPQDDSILIALDSNNDDRTAYIFEMNTLGARTDIEVSDEGSFNIDWDPIWNYVVRMDEEGYTMEAVIPFFVLRFSGSEDVDMGLLIKRRIRKNNEDVNWPYLSRDYSMSAASQYGTMAGLQGIKRGKRLEIKPYGIAGISEIEGVRDEEFDAGLDVKWGITSGLTADLTANPDFAQVESDALRVNLSRFNLFFPEKREFFLERADLFQFGLPREAEVFFSRRIGISEGSQVPILAGARVYGLEGRTNVGILNMQTREEEGISAENFTVGRVKQNILDRSYVGGIVTSRQGSAAKEDVTAGGDFLLLFENNLRFQGLLTRSGRSPVTSGNWFGSLGAGQQTDLYSWQIRYDDIGEFFEPGIGFIARPDQKTLSGTGSWNPRPKWERIRRFTFRGHFQRSENHDNIRETLRFQLVSGIDFESDDLIRGILNHQTEFVPHSFEIAPGVEIPMGEYENVEGAFSLTTSPSRKLSGNLDFYGSSFYGGDIRGTVFGVTGRPWSRLHLRFEENFSDVSVPQGSFTSAISRLYLSYFLSPDLSTRVAAQYSSLFDDFVLNFRTRWIYAPGSELWFVYNEGRQFDVPGPSLKDRSLIVKIVHNFNF